MTLEEIKKMSDEDFLKLVKTIIENSEAKDKNVTYLSPKMYKLYSWLDDNLIYGVGPITGGLFALISQALLLQYGVNEKKSAIIVGITWLSTTAFLSLFLYFDNKREKQEDRCRFEEQKIELEQNILNIKKLIEGMNEEDFALLKKGANLIKKDQISNIWIEKSNVLIVANKLVELDAIGLLNEFENTMSINDDANNYSDDKKDLGYSKSM